MDYSRQPPLKHASVNELLLCQFYTALNTYSDNEDSPIQIILDLIFSLE
jgi:hypothetical protein